MKTINDKTNAQIAEEVGLYPAEISLALNAKRLLSRRKLMKIHRAGYDIKPFVFGKSYDSMPDTPVHDQVEDPQKSNLKESA